MDMVDVGEPADMSVIGLPVGSGCRSSTPQIQRSTEINDKH
jgi:hypothetical protein